MQSVDCDDELAVLAGGKRQRPSKRETQPEQSGPAQPLSKLRIIQRSFEDGLRLGRRDVDQSWNIGCG